MKGFNILEIMRVEFVSSIDVVRFRRQLKAGNIKENHPSKELYNNDSSGLDSTSTVLLIPENKVTLSSLYQQNDFQDPSDVNCDLCHCPVENSYDPEKCKICPCGELKEYYTDSEIKTNNESELNKKITAANLKPILNVALKAMQDKVVKLDKSSGDGEQLKKGMMGDENSKLQLEQKRIDDKGLLFLSHSYDRTSIHNQPKPKTEVNATNEDSKLLEKEINCEICSCPLDTSYDPSKCKNCLPCAPEDTQLERDRTDLNYNNRSHLEVEINHFNGSNSNFKTRINVTVSSAAESVEMGEGKSHNADVKNTKNDIDCTDNVDDDTITENLNHSDDVLRSILKDMIMMLIVPVIFILPFIIYRKAKHLYERRHYVRSNYLIDGMYSERNPLCFSDVISLGDR